MSTRGQVLAKSLHTITVLQNLGGYLMDNNETLTPAKAMKEALVILKLEDKPDVYELAATAREKLVSERKKGKE